MGRAAARSPQDPAVLSSFGAVVAESWTANPGDRDLVALDNAMALLETARDMNPQSAALQSNFGYGLLRRWQADPEGVDLAAAVDALRRATELAPDQPLFFSHLAEALLAAGDYAAAAAALTAAHRLDPVDASYLTARGSWPPEGAGALADAERNYCSVDYRCGEICPRSIIGQINRVTCEMAGSSAQIACQAGEP
jgi:tetratricopeptide (TPR) repeat protein